MRIKATLKSRIGWVILLLVLVGILSYVNWNGFLSTKEGIKKSVAEETAPPLANPTAIPTPGSCRVLEEKYCWTAGEVGRGSTGETLALFTLPAGIPIFSPFTGKVSNNPMYLPNVAVFVVSEDGITNDFTIEYTGKPPESVGKNVKKGQIIARTGSIPLKLEKYVGYNLGLDLDIFNNISP